MGDRGGEGTGERERRRPSRRHGLTRDGDIPTLEGTTNTHSHHNPAVTDSAANTGTGTGSNTSASASANKRLKYSDPALSQSSFAITQAPGTSKGGLKPPSAEFTALSLLLDASNSAPTGNKNPSSIDNGNSNGNSSSRDAEDMAGKLHGKSPGPPSEDDRVGAQRRIRKVEFIRLIEQALYSLGYDKAAQELESESKVMLETGPVSSLRAAVVEGNWDESSKILRSLDDVTPELLRQAEFLLQQQKFLEFLEAGDTGSALVQLRARLTPLCRDRRRLHQLASWLMCTSREDLLARSGWTGKGSSSRLQLMLDLQALLPPTLMIPDRSVTFLCLSGASSVPSSGAIRQAREASVSAPVPLAGN